LRLLLDTHIWLWLLREPERLARRAFAELKNESNTLWLCPISIWEAVALHSRKRIHLASDVEGWLARATLGTLEAPLTHEIAAAAAQISMHRDPADRFLVATALILDMTLVTADEKLLGLGTIQTMANR
jgi:PIN domain nuclease of toxin-antitoxin system